MKSLTHHRSAWMSRKALHLRHAPWALASALAIAAFAGSFFFDQDLQDERIAGHQFSVAASESAVKLQAQIDEELARVESLGALFASGTPVDRRDFATFVDNLGVAVGTLALAWAPRVGRSERAAYEDALQRDGLAGYRIHDVTPDAHFPIAPERDEYFPIRYYSELPPAAAYGRDLADGGVRQKTLEAARDSGMLIAASILRLGPTFGGRDAVFMAYPVLDPHLPRTSAADRRRALRGFVVGLLWLGNIMEHVLSPTDGSVDIDAYVFQPEAGVTEPSAFVYSAHRRARPAPAMTRQALISRANWSGCLSLGDRCWPLIIVEAPPR